MYIYPSRFNLTSFCEEKSPLTSSKILAVVADYACVYFFVIDDFSQPIKPRRFCRDKPVKFIAFRDQNVPGIFKIL